MLSIFVNTHTPFSKPLELVHKLPFVVEGNVPLPKGTLKIIPILYWKIPIVVTYSSAGGRGEKPNVRLPKRKMRIKKRGLQISKIRVWELFTHREGISTPRAHHKGWQPLIECAQRDFKIIYFSLFIFLHFLGSTKRLPLLLCILRCDEEFRPT